MADESRSSQAEQLVFSSQEPQRLSRSERDETRTGYEGPYGVSCHTDGCRDGFHF